MADVFLDPRLPDYFKELEIGQSGLDVFLNEQIGVVRGVDLSAIDREYLSMVSLPQHWDMKKLQVGKVLSGAIAVDVADPEYFRDQLRALHAIVTPLIADLLPGVVTRPGLVVRFTEARMENLHFDNDAESDNHESFRLYINLDAAPRIWATSYQLTDLVRRGGRAITAGADQHGPAELLIKRTNTRVFGGWHQRATERQSPRHLAYFDPGDVWFLDGRSVAHQVMTGSRVLTTYCRIDHADNPGIANTHANKLRQALDTAPEFGPEQLCRFDPYSLMPTNLREDWGRVFGEIGSGGIRRFDDAGMR